MQTYNTEENDKICPYCKRICLCTEQVCECGYNFIDKTKPKTVNKAANFFIALAVMAMGQVIGLILEECLSPTVRLYILIICFAAAAIVLLYPKLFPKRK